MGKEETPAEFVWLICAAAYYYTIGDLKNYEQVMLKRAVRRRCAVLRKLLDDSNDEISSITSLRNQLQAQLLEVKGRIDSVIQHHFLEKKEYLIQRGDLALEEDEIMSWFRPGQELELVEDMNEYECDLAILEQSIADYKRSQYEIRESLNVWKNVLFKEQYASFMSDTKEQLELAAVDEIAMQRASAEFEDTMAKIKEMQERAKTLAQGYTGSIRATSQALSGASVRAASTQRSYVLERVRTMQHVVEQGKQPPQEKRVPVLN